MQRWFLIGWMVLGAPAAHASAVMGVRVDVEIISQQTAEKPLHGRVLACESFGHSAPTWPCPELGAEIDLKLDDPGALVAAGAKVGSAVRIEEFTAFNITEDGHSSHSETRFIALLPVKP